jgi:tetratricopeptide (TPR) repeat protein
LVQARAPLLVCCRESDDADCDFLNRVVAVAEPVPFSVFGLHSALTVHCTCAQHSWPDRVDARYQLPALPRLLARSADQVGLVPSAAGVDFDPFNRSHPFNLGNMLRADGRNVEAEAALRAATRADPTFADAWYNLSDLLDEQGRSAAAIECLRTTLRVAPDYTDAMFNIALLLQRQNQYAEATDYWRRYLATDCRSEWATRARRSLKFCEMQINLIASA